jgi:hypothetical protein
LDLGLNKYNLPIIRTPADIVKIAYRKWKWLSLMRMMCFLYSLLKFLPQLSKKIFYDEFFKKYYSIILL